VENAAVAVESRIILSCDLMEGDFEDRVGQFVNTRRIAVEQL
jgi:hypothetical protein